jgi:aspartate racemase
MQPEFSVIDSPEQIVPEVIEHFQRHDDKFFPPLSTRGGVSGYISSLFSMDGRLLLCYISGKLVGVMGFGFNHPEWSTYFQYIAIDQEYQGKGLPQKMVNKGIEMAVAKGETRVVARTWSTNLVMLRFFSLQGFIHFDTLYNDRGEGVHTLLFSKVIVAPEWKIPVQRVGVIGGMGTYSTGNFIRTLTGIPRSTKKEQNLLPFVLVNEPSIPDRTESILNDRMPDVISKVNEAIERTNPAGISHILFLCFTLHPYMDQLHIRSGIEKINLISIIGRMMKHNTRKTLLVATKGTYVNRLFYNFGFVFPQEDHREEIHAIIMEIKSGADPAYYKNRIAGYAQAYDCGSLVLGCTDLHGMFGFSRQYHAITIIDPLLELTFLLEAGRQSAAKAAAAEKKGTNVSVSL